MSVLSAGEVLPRFKSPVIGLDGSLNAFGVAYGGPDIPTVLLTIKGEGLRGPERLLNLRTHLGAVLLKNPDAFVSIECFPPNPKAADNLFQMGQLHGMLETLMWDHSRRYLYTTPQQVKKFVTGSCVAQKSDIAAWAVKRGWVDKTVPNPHTGKRFTEDEMDAFVLAKIGEAYLNPEMELPAYQREVMKATLAYMKKSYPWCLGAFPALDALHDTEGVLGLEAEVFA